MTSRIEDQVKIVLLGADSYLPSILPVVGDESQVATVFALAAIRRMADLVRSELVLIENGSNSSVRNLGRTILELWLYANEFLLDPDSAVERFMEEDARSQAQVQHGLSQIWEKYESQRNNEVDLRTPTKEEAERVRTNVEDWARRVVELRAARGFGSGAIAEIQYQMIYRRDSVFDVHVTLDHLFRYVNFDEGIVHLLIAPDPSDTNAFRGPESVRQDAQLLADIMGIYLTVSGQNDVLHEFKKLVVS